MIASTNTQESRKAITHYYTKLKNIKITIRGKDLIDMGLTPGYAFKKTFDAVLNAKLDKKINSKNDEKKYALEYIKKNKFID
jgi:tRNA nucleotidyltransferase (CCA-adding enzyme)